MKCTTSNRHDATEPSLFPHGISLNWQRMLEKVYKKGGKMCVLHTMYVANLLSDGNVAVEIPFVGVKKIGSIFMDDSERDRKGKDQNKSNI